MHLNASHVTTISALAILVGTEILGAALATAWAVGGLFELGPTITYAMMALFCAAGLYTLVRFIRNAIKVEPLHD